LYRHCDVGRLLGAVAEAPEFKCRYRDQK